FEQGGWNRGLIEHWFNDEEKELILNTPLLGGRDGRQIVLVAMFEWGVYGAIGILIGEIRPCTGALAVMGRLFDRHIAESRTCPICGDQEESIVHTMFSCKYAQEIWSKTEFSKLVSEALSNSFAERNKDVIEKETPKVDNITRGFVTMVEEYCAHNERTGKRGCGAGRLASYDRWCCPPNDAIKVNVDAHVSVDGKVGLGAVIRDHRGKVKVAAVHRIKARWKPEVAEARTALYGVQMARRLGFSKVVLECDVLQVVIVITTEAKGASPIFLFYDEINRLKSCFISFSCNHVKRRGNCVAHLVARGEVADGSERVWLDPIPQNYCILADLDLI
ncbi:3-isopropylmalate dehydratase large subunit, partial [Bienertia sinuspersici]